MNKLKNKKTKLIGIVTFRKGADTLRETVLGVGAEYIRWLKQWGRVVLISPDEFRDDLDLLVMQGGADINPITVSDLYPIMSGGNNPAQDYFTKQTLAKYINNGTPIMGVCAGFQALGDYYGIEIEQDFKGHNTGYDHYIVNTLHEYPLLQRVNSRHHQGFLTRNWDDSFLKPVAFSVEYLDDKDAKALMEAFNKHPNKHDLNLGINQIVFHKGDQTGCVEAFLSHNCQIAGVQFHPESNHDITEGTGYPLANTLVDMLLAAPRIAAEVSDSFTLQEAL